MAQLTDEAEVHKVLTRRLRHEPDLAIWGRLCADGNVQDVIDGFVPAASRTWSVSTDVLKATSAGNALSLWLQSTPRFPMARARRGLPRLKGFVALEAGGGGDLAPGPRRQAAFG